MRWRDRRHLYPTKQLIAVDIIIEILDILRPLPATRLILSLSLSLSIEE